MESYTIKKNRLNTAKTNESKTTWNTGNYKFIFFLLNSFFLYILKEILSEIIEKSEKI
jgi:hypothetical protein